MSRSKVFAELASQDVSKTEFNKLDGVTATTAQINALNTTGADGTVLTSTGSGEVPAFEAVADTAGYRLSDVTPFTADGTWTHDTGVTAVLVIVTGAGGGGGGKGASNDAGGGGGAGATTIEWITSGLEDTIVTCGDAGASPPSALSNGGTGGISSFGSFCTANGGVGGNQGNNQGSGGIGGSAGTTGTINLEGNSGGYGHDSMSLTHLPGGTGGGSYWGGGGDGGSYVASAKAGVNGSGGGGGMYNNSKTGAAGGVGIVVVYEYKGGA